MVGREVSGVGGGTGGVGPVVCAADAVLSAATSWFGLIEVDRCHMNRSDRAIRRDDGELHQSLAQVDGRGPVVWPVEVTKWRGDLAGVDPGADFGPTGVDPVPEAAAEDIASVEDPATRVDDGGGLESASDLRREFLSEEGFFVNEDGCVVPRSVIGTWSGEG